MPQQGQLPPLNPVAPLQKTAATAIASGDQEEGRERPDINYMPTANVLRIMRTILPADAKVPDEVRKMVQECTNEFIGFVTAEAADQCSWEHRKTITGDDLLSALARLGFNDYLQPLAVFLRRYKEVVEGSQSRRGVHGPPPLPPCPLPLLMPICAEPTPAIPKFPVSGGGEDDHGLCPPPTYIIPPRPQPKAASGVELYPLPNELYGNVAGRDFASMSDFASTSDSGGHNGGSSSMSGFGSTSGGGGGYGKFGYGHGFF